MPVNAGQYDQRITLQRRATTIGSFGQQSTTWTDIASCWAKVRPTKGRDRFAAGGVQPSIDVDSSCRVLWGGVPYAIQGEPANIGAEFVELELSCIRGAGDDS